jgi:hypothetical protein
MYQSGNIYYIYLKSNTFRPTGIEGHTCDHSVFLLGLLEGIKRKEKNILQVEDFIYACEKENNNIFFSRFACNIIRM